jgi:peptidoglycan/xylan/chitin deacetylase (PgdA/CDA1 family)
MTRIRLIQTMANGRLLLGVLSILVVLVSGCQEGEGEGSTEKEESSVFAGSYFLNAGENDPFGPPVYVLELSDSANAILTVYPTNTDEPVSSYSGSWKELEGQAEILFNEEDGQNLEVPVRAVFEIRDLFLVAVEHPFGDEEFELTIGSGDEHPAVRVLHDRLAAVPWLGFSDPGLVGTLYDPETRRAVMEFQSNQGLSPSGVVDQQTWDALKDPVPPQESIAEGALPENGSPDIGQNPTTLKVMGSGKAARVQSPSDVGMIEDRPTHIDGQPVIYLTFDDGPTKYTPRFVESLTRYNARGTFFVLGLQVDGAPHIAGQAAEAGNYLANHTYNHPYLTWLGQAQFNSEILSTQDAIQRATNGQDQERTKPLCLRPPYRAKNANTYAYAAALGYELVLWDIDPQDWRQPGANQIANHVISYAYPGAIVLMHDGGGYREQSVAALELVLQSLSEQGYRFEALCQ